PAWPKAVLPPSSIPVRHGVPCRDLQGSSDLGLPFEPRPAARYSATRRRDNFTGEINHEGLGMSTLLQLSSAADTKGQAGCLTDADGQAGSLTYAEPHPLEPLTAHEVAQTVGILKA